MSDFERPSLSTLIDRAKTDINGRVTGAESRLRRSFLETLAKVNAGGLNGLYGYADYIAKQTLPDEATDWLPRHAAIWGIAPKAATLATGLITVTGADGAEIPAGTELQRADGVLYVTTADASIDGASEDIAVTAVVAGASGNASAGTAVTFISPVPSVSSAAVVAGGGLFGGNDAEKDEQLRSRILQRIRKRPQGGSADDYEAWALEVAGVTRAWIYPRWMGPGTVGITFVMDDRDNIFPLQADLDAVIAHVGPLRSVCADLYVFAPTPMPINFAIRLTPNTAKVRAAAEAELRDMIERDAEPGGVILLSRINEALSITPGEEDHVVQSPLDDVDAGAGALPVFGSIEWIDD